MLSHLSRRSLIPTAIPVALLMLLGACGPHLSAAGTLPTPTCNAPVSPPATGHNYIPSSVIIRVVAHGQTACISGNGFGSKRGQVLFYRGPQTQGVVGQITSWSNTLIRVVVPSQAHTGPVDVVSSSGESSYPGPIFILNAANRVAKLAAESVSAPLPGQPTGLRLQARDSSGRGVSGALVDVTDQQGLGTVSCTTNNSGRCQVTFTPYQSLSLVVISGTSWTEVIVKVTQPPDERMALKTSAADLIDGQSATLTAVVTYANGQPVPGQAVNFSTNDAPAVFNPSRAVTDSTGTATTTVTVSEPDNVIIQADTNDEETVQVVSINWSTNVVTSISPTSGPVGTVVTVQGAGFTPSAKVLFGQKDAQSVTFVNSNTLRAVAPAGSGVVRVAVEVGGQYSDYLNGPQFTYS